MGAPKGRNTTNDKFICRLWYQRIDFYANHKSSGWAKFQEYLLVEEKLLPCL